MAGAQCEGHRNWEIERGFSAIESRRYRQGGFRCPRMPRLSPSMPRANCSGFSQCLGERFTGFTCGGHGGSCGLLRAQPVDGPGWERHRENQWEGCPSKGRLTNSLRRLWADDAGVGGRFDRGLTPWRSCDERPSCDTPRSLWGLMFEWRGWVERPRGSCEDSASPRRDGCCARIRESWLSGLLDPRAPRERRPRCDGRAEAPVQG